MPTPASPKPAGLGASVLGMSAGGRLARRGWRGLGLALAAHAKYNAAWASALPTRGASTRVASATDASSCDARPHAYAWPPGKRFLGRRLGAMTPWPLIVHGAVVVTAGLPALVGVAALVATVRGVFDMPLLARVNVTRRETWPRVSMVVPACDERESVEAALRSSLDQHYPDLEIVAVDDRSTDGTGEILDRLAADDARVRVAHVTALPDGWLGKVHALARGVERCSGEWLLFADADVHLERETLKRAISYADEHAVDFVSVMPEIASAGFLGDCCFNVSMAAFCLGTRPWRIRDTSSSAIGATGAFMLVRRTAFDRTPGFEWLKLEVADDFGLCLMIKSFGGRCDLLNGRGEVRLRWYASLGEMSRKMQKNFYAITGRFSMVRILAQVALLLWLGLFPLVLPAVAPAQWVAWLVALGLGSHIVNAVVAAVWLRRPVVPALFAPLGFVVLAALVLRAGLVGHRQRGITWRGVLYPTSLLRAHQRVKV